MKHLKLFESFDRYEFGEFTGNNEIADKMNDVMKTARDKRFTPEQYAQIKAIIPNYTTHMGWVDFTRGVNFIRESFRLFDLGDYCYALVKMVNEFNKDLIMYDRLWIMDDFDAVLKKLQEIVDEHGVDKLYEGVSRYDFGKYTTTQEIQQVFDTFQAVGDQFDELGVFSDTDFSELDNVLPPGGFYATNKPKNTITLRIDDKYILVYALGDYCYAFFVEDEFIRDWIYCEIIDGIDDLCEVLKKFITQSNSLNESITRHDFGVYTNHEEILDFLGSVRDNRLKFTPNEIHGIKQVLGSKYEIEDEGIYCSITGDNLNDNQMCLYSFGDYCYGISLGEYGRDFTGFHEYKKLYLIDEFDEFLNILKQTIDAL